MASGSPSLCVRWRRRPERTGRAGTEPALWRNHCPSLDAMLPPGDVLANLSLSLALPLAPEAEGTEESLAQGMSMFLDLALLT